MRTRAIWKIYSSVKGRTCSGTWLYRTDCGCVYSGICAKRIRRRTTDYKNCMSVEMLLKMSKALQCQTLTE